MNFVIGRASVQIRQQLRAQHWSYHATCLQPSCRCMLACSSLSMKIDGTAAQPVQRIGMHQGRPLSPTLFGVFFNASHDICRRLLLLLACSSDLGDWHLCLCMLMMWHCSRGHVMGCSSRLKACENSVTQLTMLSIWAQIWASPSAPPRAKLWGSTRQTGDI